ncbi:MAG: hypothetical protein ABEJ88_03525 [Halobacterium sp.]
MSTFERVREPDPANFQFRGGTVVATGFRFGAAESVLEMAFAFSAPDEAVVDPVSAAFESTPGTRQYEDVAYESDGRLVTVTARMPTERFDGYLPGDPGDR